MEKYDVTGMSCAACVAHVEKAVRSVPGVNDVSVNLLTNSMAVYGTADENMICDAVSKAGYHASPVGASLDKAGDKPRDLSDKETPKMIRRLILSVVFLLPLMYVSMGHMMWGWPLPVFLQDNHIGMGIYEMLFAIVVMFINRKFFINGISGAIHKAPNMDTLVALGSGVSFGYSVVILFAMTYAASHNDSEAVMGYMHEFYFESAAMILTLITVGKTLEAYSKGRTTDAIKGLLELAPKMATLRRDGKEVVIPAAQVKVGDIFIVRAGGAFPVDGVVTEGSGNVDESALTGESVAVEKDIGHEVSVGTILLSGELCCEATRVGSDTTLSKIVELVSDAAATKAPIARVADRVANVFVPVVLAIAFITAVVWLVIGAPIGTALSHAITVLVISCPCALGLATPVAIMVGGGVGAKHGILYKNSVSLEQAGRADIVVMDKTGTITQGLTDAPDEIRPESAAAIKELKNMGFYTVMLSGDKVHIAERIAAQAGVDEVIAGVLPDGKEAVIRKLQKHGSVIMVGDGINDAPALKRAEVGFAIGAGKDIAIDAADVVLVNSKLSDVPAAIRLSKSVLNNIRENLFWAFIYNVIGIPLAAGVWIPITGWSLTPMFGAAAMSLSSFCVVMNALRLNLIDIYSPKKFLRQSPFNDGEKLYNKEKNGGKDAMEKTLSIEGMMCEKCEAHVRKALEALDGVAEVKEVSHDKNVAVVSINGDVSEDALKAAVEEAGYDFKGVA